MEVFRTGEGRDNSDTAMVRWCGDVRSVLNGDPFEERAEDSDALVDEPQVA